MLNRGELFFQLQKLSSRLFKDLSYESEIAQSKLNEISQDPFFKNKAEKSNSSFLVPSWNGNLTDVFDIKYYLDKYSVLAVDGSQVYPDRNVSGAGCFLINTGGCFINYSEKSETRFFSEPTVFLIEDVLEKGINIGFSKDLVDFKREELELEKLLNVGLEKRVDLCLVDGTVIFWSLGGKQDEIKDLFLEKYLKYLDRFYEEKLLIAGFISFPKSKEIVNLIKLGLCRFDFAECIACHRDFAEFPCAAVDSLIDTQILRSFLKINQRSTIFFSNSKIVEEYPEHLKPAFFYLNLGKEIVRIETFSWVIRNPEWIDFICRVAIDQSKKGFGYPVVLAEAHEQAVVKGPDREFFYYLLQKEAIEQNKRLFYSQKSLKKRGLGI